METAQGPAVRNFAEENCLETNRPCGLGNPQLHCAWWIFHGRSLWAKFPAKDNQEPSVLQQNQFRKLKEQPSILPCWCSHWVWKSPVRVRRDRIENPAGCFTCLRSFLCERVPVFIRRASYDHKMYPHVHETSGFFSAVFTLIFNPPLNGQLNKPHQTGNGKSWHMIFSHIHIKEATTLLPRMQVSRFRPWRQMQVRICCLETTETKQTFLTGERIPRTGIMVCRMRTCCPFFLQWLKPCHVPCSGGKHFTLLKLQLWMCWPCQRKQPDSIPHKL